MSLVSRNRSRQAGQEGQMKPLPVYLNARAVFADRFLFGRGLEIGPLHQPLEIPSRAEVRYVDRMKTDQLRREYPEVAALDLVEVDVVDDGETLSTIPTQSQDFIVANHFLEHCENPIGTIENHLDKLKPGGVLFYAVPDKRFTFDFRRPVTPLEHMIADYEDGPEQSRREHYEDWCRFVVDESGAARASEDAPSEESISRRARELEAAKYSIHMHAWTQGEFLGLILALRERFDESFDIEAAARIGIEFVVVLRKEGPLPPAPPPFEPSGSGPRAGSERWRRGGTRLLALTRERIRRWRSRP